MSNPQKNCVSICGFTALALVMAAPAFAQDAPPGEDAQPAGVGEIIVTAQKRSQSINTVGMSINAATSEQLDARGVKSVEDLAKVVPGFTYQPSPYSTPVYTIRGIGLYDNGLASAPAVTTYVDEAPLPFPAMTTGATLDIERVEILKGPQGTLFGQNSTGGAINYIAAKPTDSFAAGGNISYERFGLFDGSAYVSGPLSDTLRARVAVRGVSGGEWQYSLTRPEDRRGATRLLVGRALLDWTPSDRVEFSLNINGFRDRSDTQAQQFQENILNVSPVANAANPYTIIDPVRYAALTDPTSPRYDNSFIGRQQLVIARLQGAGGAQLQQITNGALGGPVAPDNPRAADWTPEWPSQMDKKYYQFALRGGIELSDDIKLTSITSYQRLDSDVYQDLDAVAAFAQDYRQFGTVKSLSQELRLSGETGHLNWMIGGNYDHVKQDETAQPHFLGLSLNEPVPGLIFSVSQNRLTQNVKSLAAFGNVEYEIVDNLTLQGGIRYTDVNRTAGICSSDPTPEQNISTFFTAITGVAIAPGQCYQVDVATFRPVLEPDIQTLDEKNTSWRLGINYKTGNGGLLYANASRGYKAGIFSTILGSFTIQSDPAVQERVDAYEVGIKMPLLDRRVQFNAAGFYYDYKNKQIRAKLLDPTFGLLEKLINLPQSRVWGIEAEMIAQPIEGLNLSASATYMRSKVTSDDPANSFYNQEGYFGTFYGSRLPYTPTFTGLVDAQYEWAINGDLTAFVGGTVKRQSRSNATTGNDVLLNDEYVIKGYTTLDLRAGVSGPDNRWRISIFGRNVTDEFIVTTVFNNSDARYRYTAKPATYGVSLSFKL